MAEKIAHPAHYGGDTQHECIKVLQSWLSREEYIGFLKGNAVKYLSRAGKKEGESMAEDIGKSRWYADRLAKFLASEEGITDL